MILFCPPMYFLYNKIHHSTRKHNHERKIHHKMLHSKHNFERTEWNSEEQILIWRKVWADVTNAALELNKIGISTDCRSFKECGIDEQSTIHTGVAARIMERREIISEKYALNREIKANRKKVVSSLLQRYDKLTKGAHTKRNRLKKLKAEKRSVNPINFIKHNQLDKQIDELTADIKNLNLQIVDILRELNCIDESELTVVKNTLNRNSEIANKLKTRNDALTAETETEKSHYTEVREAIPSEDAEAVRSERRSIRDGIIAKAARLLQSTYGRKYSGDMLTEVENEIDTDLNEKPFEKRSLREQLKEQPHDIQNEDKDKRRGYER